MADKPSMMEGFREPMESADEESGLDSGAAFEELRTRFLNGSPEEAKDAFSGLVSMCEEESEGEGPLATGKKPPLSTAVNAYGK